MSELQQYFKDLDVSRVHNTRILLDYEGTIKAAGAEMIDEASAAVVKRLVAQGNDVFICSNSSPNPEVEASLAVTWLKLDMPKPRVGKVLHDIVADTTKQLIMIGNLRSEDGALAAKLGIPFLLVKGLGKHGIPFFDRFFKVRTGEPAVFSNIEDETITLLTLDPREVHDGRDKTAKQIAKNILQGMHEAGFPALLDPQPELISPTVCIIGSSGALSYALERKRRGFIGTIIAGPELSVVEAEHRQLLENSGVDRMVVSNEGIKTAWSKLDQYFNRVEVVPIGVPDLGARMESAQKTGECIVDASDVSEPLFHEIMKTLWQHQLSINVSRDGNFKNGQYEQLLKNARCVIYLADSDASDTPLKHAWMADVPTLSLGGDIPATCGKTFSGSADFDAVLTSFLADSKTFSPRAYAAAQCSLAGSIGRYVQVIRAAQAQRSV